MSRTESFNQWVHNLHDVFLTAQLTRLLVDFVPPSEVNDDLEALRASRAMRLERCFVRDLWVLWEAWDRNSQFARHFRETSPSQVATLEEVIGAGQVSGALDLMHDVRDYMCHRDKRRYWDAGRADIDADQRGWFERLYQAFSDLFIHTMVSSSPARAFVAEAMASAVEDGSLATLGASSIDHPGNDASETSFDGLARSCVDDSLLGFIESTLASGGVETQEQRAIAEGIGHSARAFVTSVVSNEKLSGPCATALVRRAVLALHKLRELDRMTDGALAGPLVSNLTEDEAAILSCLDAGGLEAAVASNDPPLHEDANLCDLRRDAMFRFVDWLSETGDVRGAIGGLLRLTSRLYLPIVLAGDERASDIVEGLGAEADQI